MLPCLIELHAGNPGQNFDHLRRCSHSKKDIRVDQVLGPQVAKRRSEFRQGRENSLRILRAWLNKKIEVLGRTGLSVNGDGVPANDEVLNAVLVERGQEFFEVLTEHRALVPSIDAPSPTVRRRYPAAHGPGGFASSGIRPLSSH